MSIQAVSILTPFAVFTAAAAALCVGALTCAFRAEGASLDLLRNPVPRGRSDAAFGASVAAAVAGSTQWGLRPTD